MIRRTDVLVAFVAAFVGSATVTWWAFRHALDVDRGAS